AAADLVNSCQDTFVVWVNTNYESDELIPLIPDAVEVRGSESIAEKERKLLAFTNGERRAIICKPSMFGYGLNWQHCHRMVFVGLDYSFENFYQAIRRCYRFGQTQPVEVTIIAANTEAPLITAIERKVRDHQRMSESMNNTARLSLAEGRHLSRYNPQLPMILPDWLQERYYAA
ncbi:MAG: helicase C-terminal domain-containing protein, partial [Ktedonobacteraceae bacterium]